MKKTKQYLVALVVFMILVLPSTVFAAETDREEWTNNQTVSVTIAEEYLEEGKVFTADDFPEVDIAGIFIRNKSEQKVDELLLVLNTSDVSEVEAAVAELNENPIVSSAAHVEEVPFESVIKLNKHEMTMKVGEKVTLKVEEKQLFRPSMSYSGIYVSLSDYDEEKVYTVDDFPQYELESVDQMYDNLFSLELKEDNYFNVINALNAFAADPDIKDVSTVGVGYADWIIVSWKPSNQSVVKLDYPDDFTGTKYENEDGMLQYTDEIVVEGLKEGETTITYDYYHDGYQGTATCTVKVVNADVPSEEPATATHNNYGSNVNNSAKSPKTSQSMTPTLIFTCLLCISSIVIIAILKKGKVKT